MSIAASHRTPIVAAKTPFRADHIGSLLRPMALQEARKQLAAGEITKEGLERVEDRAIGEAVALQRAAGFRVLSDGEYRRTYFHLDFLEQIEGVDIYLDHSTAHFHKANGETLDFSPPKMRIIGKLKRTKPILARDYQVLAGHVGSIGTAKITLPSPTMAHFRTGRRGVDATAYPDMAEFFDDLARVYREELADLTTAGCRYLQMDDTNLAYLCDENMREGSRKLGEDPDTLPALYASLINASLKDVPDNVYTAIHLCRGNFKSAFVAEGGYDRVAEVMFNEIDIDAFLLEFDDERSGSFEPLRFLPKGKQVVLGLISSKLPALESKDEIKRRVEEAAKFAPLDQLCLSPQCGFSSTCHGNDLSFDDQRRKLELVVACAEEIWG